LSGCAVIAISADADALTAEMCSAIGAAFPLLSDPSAAAITRLGLADSDEQVAHLIARPAVFVVDRAGIVRYRYLSRSADDRPKVELLLLAAERLAAEQGELAKRD
jgi:peroxiredoxin